MVGFYTLLLSLFLMYLSYRVAMLDRLTEAAILKAKKKEAGG
jgi:hypothetical protein